MVVVVSAMGKTTDDLLRLAHEVSPTPHRPRAGHAPDGGRAISMSCCAWPSGRGEAATSFHGQPGRDRHRHGPRNGPRSWRFAPTASPSIGTARSWWWRASRECRLPATSPPSAVAALTPPPCPGGIVEVGSVRDLHRRTTGSYRTIPESFPVPAVASGFLRGDAGDLRHGWAGAGHAVGWSSPEPWSSRACAVRSRGSLGPGRRGGRVGAGHHPAITHDTSEAEVTIVGVPDRPGIRRSALPGPREQSVNVDMIVQKHLGGGTTDISFTVPKDDSSRLKVTESPRRGARRDGVTHDATSLASAWWGRV